MQYSFRDIEAKWQRIWREQETYKVQNGLDKPTCYVLDMFPYPSGAGLHVGHPLGYIASDIYARYKRLCGYNVLHPMGFDSFGLPAEQYALETGQHPAATTEKNIARYKEQLGIIGFCYDWSREVRTSDPAYYRWTQWIFLQLFNSWYNPDTNKAEPIRSLTQRLQEADPGLKGKAMADALMPYRLAYRAESYVNWCEALGTVLANDEVVNGVSERGGHPVERRLMSQWFLRITAYADRLLEGLERVDFPESLKEMQRNWIGRSEGAEITFAVKGHNAEKAGIRVFTTRPDTLFGVSFMVMAPEHELLQSIVPENHRSEVESYQRYVSSRSERERMADTKQISGCFTGAYAIHPLTGEELPVWISEYVLAGYGTGAIMAVPAGDERDHAFARHFSLPIPWIFEGHSIADGPCTDKQAVLSASGFLSGKKAAEAMPEMLDHLESQGLGKRRVNYRMRDAGFSRQRYWGEPFPIVYAEDGTTIALPEAELPLELPHLPSYQAGPNGQGPLANAADWVNSPAGKRETDTMPGYAGSSWYYLRYLDPKNDQAFCDRSASDYWGPVDVYIGGAEHAVGHLLYSRMWCKALFDLGHIGFDEPYKKLINQGMIQGSSRFVHRVRGSQATFVSRGLSNQHETDLLHVDVSMVDGHVLDLEAFKTWRPEWANAEFITEEGQFLCSDTVEKMSKSKYNVVNPDEIIAQYGADTFRMYEMFLGPLDVSKPWDTKGIEGVHRFLRKFWRLFADETGLLLTEDAATPAENKLLHKHIRKIAHDIEHFALNTAVSQFMIITNELSTLNCHRKEILLPLLVTLVPFAPHLCEELWAACGQSGSVLDAAFPQADEKFLVENAFKYPIAIQGKPRAEMELELELSSDEIQARVLANETVQKWMNGQPLKKFIFVKGKMINVVV
jgi:leucyl-tRNA synthetase